jgi:transcriptional regulator of arginine metabolism
MCIIIRFLMYKNTNGVSSMTEDDFALKRQNAIVDLLKKVNISDQNQLVELLKKYYGIETNQVTMSRDLRKLGVVKQLINETLTYHLPQTDVKAEILRLALIDISYNEVTIVIKTYPGLAAFVGDSIDQNKELEVLGCLAGENAVFVTPKSIKKIKQTYEIICEKLNFKIKKDL